MLPLSLSLSLKRTHRDLFLRDDGDGISAPDADGRVARGLCGLEGVFCRWFVHFFARISRESVSESTSRMRPRSRRESRLRGAEGERDSDGRRDRFFETIDPSLDRPPPPSFFPPLSASPALFSTASTCLRRRTDLVEPAVRGEDRDVAVVAAARAARHGCKKSKRGDRERKRRRRRRCPLASSFLR